jgi:poly(3-hydroxybutyrate) depolymerase
MMLDDVPQYLGGDRLATYILPDNYDPRTPTPLILSLHGYTRTARGQDRYFELSEYTRRHGIILILPTGRLNPEGNRFWSATDYCCDLYDQGDQDLAYLVGLIDEAKRYFTIDENTIAIIGHSNGGFMGYRLACEAADVITHVVSLAGASWYNPDHCSDPKPVSVLQIHGSLDLVIRYEGQQFTEGDPDAMWNIEPCWNLLCREPKSLCAESAACAEIWSCMNRCGWDAINEYCRNECYEDASEEAQLLWVEEFACALNAGCTDNPAETHAGYSGAVETVQRWTQRNRCVGDSVTQSDLDLDFTIDGAETKRLAWTQCDQGTVTGLWTIDQGRHSPALSYRFSEYLVQWILGQEIE